MTNILNYLKENIDKNAYMEVWNAKPYLNLQLAGSYLYYLVTILGETFLLIKPLEEQTPSQIKIHINRIRDKVSYEIAILLENPTPYLTKKMLEERVPFLTVDKQMYLPFMALHIKQTRLKKIETEEREKFTAATQMVFLSILYSDKTMFTTEELMKSLNVSAMTILRAMNVLNRLGIIHQEIAGQTGRKKVFKPINNKEFYRTGKEYLINPVRKSFYVSYIPEEIKVYKTGLTALSEQTMLGAPTHETYAIHEKISALIKYQVTKAQALIEGLPELQLMQYDIGKLTDSQYVDPITLILSLNKKDDRTEIAIDELMEKMEWYED